MFETWATCLKVALRGKGNDLLKNSWECFAFSQLSMSGFRF